MKKLLYISLLLLCCGVDVLYAQSMRALFMSAPDGMFPLLTMNNRADCVDYIDAGMEAKVSNRLGGVCRMKTLTADYMLLEPTSVSSVQAKCLPYGGDTIVCVVKSVKAEAAGSRIEFYDTEWNRLSAADFFDAPAIVDFFISPDSAARYADRCDIYLVKMSLSEKGNILTAEYTMPDYMDESDATLLKPLLHGIVYRWNGKRFVRE